MQVIAIIPTNGRPDLLRRAVESVISQSRKPDRLIVVHEQTDVIEMAVPKSINIHVTDNSRSKSLSGAINHALDEIILHRHGWQIEPQQTWLALLDDDDWWDESYIERCMELAQGGVQQVVSGLHRYDVERPRGFPLSIPTSLQVESFLVKNPHIQGSNLFVRMDAFLEAGGFDEALQSCTDRDVCIRLFERPHHQWARLDAHLVHHDARNSGRISDPASNRKRDGLTRFAMKHQFRMNDHVWREFVTMSQERFGVSIKCRLANTKNQMSARLTDSGRNPLSEPFELTIAVTMSNLCLAEQFLPSVSTLADDWPWKVRLVICLHNLSPEVLDPLLSKINSSLAEVIIHEESWGHRLAEEERLGPWFLNQENRSGVSWGRCVLHRAALDAVLEDRRPAIWIVDEDIILEDGVWSRGGSKCSFGATPLKEAIAFMHESDLDVGIGTIIGDPPLPLLYTQRTQLLDLHHAQLKRSSGRGWRIKWGIDNQRDLHHDLASHRWDHLEFPWGLERELSNGTEGTGSVLQGKSRTRAVHNDWENRSDSDLIFRGGNTLILDPNVLNEWSNVAPNVGGIQFRRGDSFWALWAQRIRGLHVGKEFRNVNWIPFAIPQCRIEGHSANQSVSNIRGDILASMLLRELELVLPLGAMEENRQSIKCSSWSALLPERSLRSSKRREARLIANLFRIRQLATMLGEDYPHESTLAELWKTSIPDEVCDGLVSFFAEFEKDMVKFRSMQPKARYGHQVERAWQVYLEAGGTVNAIVAGHGSEGVVFKENGQATKVLHDGIHRAKERHVLFNKQLSEKGDLSGLPKAFRIEKIGEEILVRYEWVEGQHPTMKTPIQAWLSLLRSCRNNGFTFWDIKPQNLIFTPSEELVIIDLGRNMKPFTEHAWGSMIRKAFLCWRWWFRPDLRFLLTRSIREDTPEKMPELTDIKQFIEAIEIQDKAELHDSWFADLIRPYAPGKLLDWGCGKGTLSKQIATVGFDVDAWDPIHYDRHRVEDHPKVKWIEGESNVKTNNYDVGIANLVLCEIAVDKEAIEVLTTLRRAVGESGKVFVTVCHPMQMCTRCSTTVERPDIRLDNGRLSYEKRVRSTDRVRTEYVRSLDRLEILALHANLKAVKHHESPGVDVYRCAPMPEYLAIEFKPLPTPRYTDVELLILACSMDHSIVERQVEHLVRQLGGRGRFKRVVLLTDDATTGFTRPWMEPDIEKFRGALARLMESGTIDEVLWAPQDDHNVQCLNKRWYGESVPIQKAVNGQPVYTSLWGLEQLTSRYVLQTDVDIMMHRDWSIDPADLLIDCLLEQDGITATLPILSDSDSPPRVLDGNDWRTEVRFCMLDREKTLLLRPMKNSVDNGQWSLPWHKTMDAYLKETEGGSFRLADGRNWFVHPQNGDKIYSMSLHRVRRRIERGEASQLQEGHVDLVCWDDSHGLRTEGIIIVVRGRNTPYSLIQRHIRSLLSQTDQEYGIIWVDAGSDDGSLPHIESILDAEFGDRVTYIWNDTPLPRCENILLASERVDDPEAVLVLLDADDALSGPEVISHVRDVFAEETEVAVGGMLRLDKHKRYPANFVNPRSNRGGNVWQHLKCFRKRIIDQIPVEMFKIDGKFIQDEDDWALMLPIVEVASHHHEFTRPMMIYTISENKLARSRDEREARIARIVQKPSLLDVLPQHSMEAHL